MMNDFFTFYFYSSPLRNFDSFVAARVSASVNAGI